MGRRCKDKTPPVMADGSLSGVALDHQAMTLGCVSFSTKRPLLLRQLLLAQLPSFILFDLITPLYANHSSLVYSPFTFTSKL